MIFAALDWWLVALYIAVVLIVGIWASIRETSEGFLLADRKLGAFSNLATIVSSKTGAGLILTLVALIYLYGLSALWFFAGASIGYIIFIFFARRLREDSKGKYYTLSDYFFGRFGKTAGFISAFIIFVVMSINFVIQLIGSAKIIGSLTSFNYLAGLLLISGTIIIYLLFGGFKAVVRTDIIQFLSIIIVAALLVIVLSGRWSTALAEVQWSAMAGKDIAGFFMFGILIPFASAELWQRIYAAKDYPTVRNSLIGSAISYFIIGALFALIGLAIRGSISGIDPDLALVEGFKVLLPAGLSGLGVVAILAAIMSSADTYLFTNTSILFQDFVQRIKRFSKEKLVAVFRWGMVFVLLVGIILAITLQSVVNAAFLYTGFASVIALVAMLSWIKKTIRPITLNTGLIVGFLGVLVFAFIFPLDAQFIPKALGVTIVGLVLGAIIGLFVRSKQPTLQ